MSARYLGGIVSRDPLTLNPAAGNAANGVFTLEQYMQAVKNATWPGFDPYFKQNVLLLHGNGTNGAQNNTFLDGSTNNFTITRNGNTTQGTFSPFSLAAGEWSNYFDGTGDSLTRAFTSTTDGMYLQGSTYTIEAWVYPNALSGTQYIYICNASNVSQYGYNTLYLSGTSVAFATRVSTGGTEYARSGGTLTVGQWSHIAVSVNSNVAKLFLNGVQIGADLTIAANTFTPTGAGIGLNQNGAAGGTAFNGYISNLRVVQGTAVYTSNFTPSTTPLTAITNTSLLTCQSNRFVDNSTNAFAITRNGDVRVTPFSPFAPSAAYSAGTNGGSGYFDGSGDYLTIADNTALDMEASDFTIECWFYPVVTPNQSICSKRSTSADFAGVIIYFSNSTTPKALATVNGTTWGVDMTSSININVGQWSHLALTRSSNTWTLWVNGVSGATATVSGTVPNNAGAFAVGAGGADGSFILTQSHIANFRVVKGTALYSTTFTPPTSPLTAVANTSLLLNFTNAGIIDNTGKNVLETVGNAQIDTAVKKYGTGSLEFDGTDDNIFIPATPDLGLGTGNFTIEFWVNTASSSTSSMYLDMRGSSISNNGIAIYQNSSAYTVNNGSTQLITGGTVVANQFQHIAVTRSSGSLRLFINGTQVGSTATLTTDLPANTVMIGKIPSLTTWNFTGYIDDLRITKGVARYTANFTPQTSQWQDQ